MEWVGCVEWTCPAAAVVSGGPTPPRREPLAFPFPFPFPSRRRFHYSGAPSLLRCTSPVQQLPHFSRRLLLLLPAPLYQRPFLPFNTLLLRLTTLLVIPPASLSLFLLFARSHPPLPRHPDHDRPLRHFDQRTRRAASTPNLNIIRKLAPRRQLRFCPLLPRAPSFRYIF
jgi:hypothetical protein